MKKFHEVRRVEPTQDISRDLPWTEVYSKPGIYTDDYKFSRTIIMSNGKRIMRTYFSSNQLRELTSSLSELNGYIQRRNDEEEEEDEEEELK